MIIKNSTFAYKQFFRVAGSYNGIILIASNSVPLVLSLLMYSLLNITFAVISGIIVCGRIGHATILAMISKASYAYLLVTSLYIFHIPFPGNRILNKTYTYSIPRKVI